MTASLRSRKPYMDDPPPPISRDELVAEVLSFYEFLVNMFLPEEALKRPPPSGWPSITPERFGFLQKDETVLDILRHLPYIRADTSDPELYVYYDCHGNDYSGQYFESNAIRYENEEAVDPVPEALENSVALLEIGKENPSRLPPHVFTLARGIPSDDGYIILCNTREGTMNLVNFVNGSDFQTGVRSFFCALKDEYRDLEVIPRGVHNMGRDGIVVHRMDPGEYGSLRDIFRKHGWPSENYDKDACMAELEVAMERQVQESLQR